MSAFWRARPVAAILGAILGMCMIAAASSPAFAQNRKGEIYTGLLSSVAAGGYDPVAYFSSGKPVEGRSDLTFEWKGATWRFASADNLEAFKAKPQAYAPQFGGHCAWAVSQGYKAKGDPRHWRIVDGKLYLNYDARIHATWQGDIPGHISKADQNWPSVLAK